MRAARPLAGVSAPLLMREHWHRRALLLTLTTLLLLSILPIFGHHITEIAEPVSRVQHLGAVCVTALAQILVPIHWGFHVALVLGIAYAIWDRFRAAKKLTMAISPLESWRPLRSDPIARAAIAAGVNPDIVRVVHALPNPAFTVGTLSPRIYVAEDLPERLQLPELAMVLAHEAAHIAHRDPLRLAVYRFLSFTLFWIPALRRLADDMADEAEIRADDAAAANRPLVLASAILQLAATPATRQLFGTVGFESRDLLDRRIRRLAGEDTPLPSHLTRASVAGACLSISLILLSGLAAAQSDHRGEGSHCRHSGAFPFAHLICMTGGASAAPHCPHTR
jgi:Zn-dependent protease with chaperone function